MKTNLLKKILFYFLFISNSIQTYAQVPTVQDCLGAIPICQDVYSEPYPYPYSGTDGNYLNEIYNNFGTSNCITLENNGMWYLFTTQSSGKLRFSITAQNPYTDYDWIVFDLTYATCADLGTSQMNTYMLSSNTYGGIQGEDIVLGPTGASSIQSNGTAGNCNGPGQGNGPSWNDDIPVTAGHTYVLYLSNWDGSLDGYTIDFSASTAILYDDKPPIVAELTTQTNFCSLNTIDITFNENVLCASVTSADFLVTFSDGTVLPIVSISSDACDVGAEYGKHYTLHLGSNVVQGTYTISLQPHTNLSVMDICQNTATPYIYTFTYSNNFTLLPTNPSCFNSADGTITVSNTNINFPVQYSINGGLTYQTSNVFTGLTAGTYTIVEKDASGCKSVTKTVTLINPAQAEQSVAQTVTFTPACLVSKFLINFSQPINCNTAVAEDFTITSSDGISHVVTNVNCTGNNNSVFEIECSPALANGNYTVHVNPSTTNSLLGDCNLQALPADINFSNNFVNQIISNPTPQDPTCYNFSDGIITVITQNTSGTVQYSIDGGLTFQNSNIFTNLPAGNYEIQISDSKGCADTTAQVILVNPPIGNLPEIGQAIPNPACNSQTISFTFSEPVICSSVSLSDFTLSSNNGNSYNITEITPLNCSGSPAVATQFQITTSQVLTTGLFTLSANPNTVNSLQNKCNISANPSSTSFFLNNDSPLLVNTSASNPSCTDFLDGTITATTQNGQGNVLYSIDGGVTFLNNNGLFTNLPPGLYQILVQDANGCTAQSAYITLENPIQGIPSALQNVVSPTACSSQELTFLFSKNVLCSTVHTSDFELTDDLGTQYTISFINSDACNLGFQHSNEFTITVTPPMLPGNYTLNLLSTNKITDNCGLSASPNSISFVYPDISPVQLIPDFQNPSCPGQNDGTISVQALNTQGNVQYSIDGGVTFIANNGLFTGLSAGSYQIIAIDDNSCATQTSEIILTEPSANSFATLRNIKPQEGCQADTVTFRFTKDILCSSVNSSDFQLNSANGTPYNIISLTGNCVANFANTFTLTVSPPMLAGDYTLSFVPQTGSSGQDKCGNIAQPDNISFTIQDKSPITVLNDFSNPSCPNFSDGTILLFPENTVGNVRYSLDGGVTFFQNNGLFTGLAAGNYQVTIMDDASCISQTNTIILQDPAANALPALQEVKQPTGCTFTGLAFYFTKSVLCSSISTTDFNIVSQNGVNYTITSISSPLCDTGELQSNLFVLQTNPALQAGNYTLELLPQTVNSVLDNCSNAAVTQSLPFTYLLNQEIISTPTPTNPSCFNYNDGAIKLNTTNANGTVSYSIDGGNSFITENEFLNLPAGNYQILSKDETGCTGTSNTITLTNPVEIFANAGADIFACGSEYSLNAIPTVGTTGFWTSSSVNSVFSNYTNPQSLIQNINDTPLLLTWTVSNGSCNAIDQVNVIPQHAKAGADTAICLGKSIHLSATGANNYIWTNGIHQNEDFYPTETQTYAVLNADGINCTQDEVTITVNPNPVVLSTDLSILYRIAIQGQSLAEPLTYQINTGEENLTGEFLGLSPGTYYITLTDTLGCQEKTSPIIVSELELIIPTIYTPNGDGINDRWEIKGIDQVPDADIFIYDRWGKLLAQYKGSDQGWDGTYNNNPVASDTYWYVVKAINKIEFKGHLTIKR